MIFSAAELTTFFTDNLQMGLTDAHRTALQREGLVNIEDFADFKEKEIKVAIKNARAGVPTVPGFLPVPPIAAVPAVLPDLQYPRYQLKPPFLRFPLSLKRETDVEMLFKKQFPLCQPYQLSQRFLLCQLSQQCLQCQQGRDYLALVQSQEFQQH